MKRKFDASPNCVYGENCECGEKREYSQAFLTSKGLEGGKKILATTSGKDVELHHIWAFFICYIPELEAKLLPAQYLKLASTDSLIYYYYSYQCGTKSGFGRTVN